MSNRRNKSPIIGKKVQRVPHGRMGEVTAITQDKIKVKDVFWHGWMNIATFNRKWKFVPVKTVWVWV